MVRRKIITMCSSANFYEHTNQVAQELIKMGYKIKIPVTIKKMKTAGNFKAEDYRTWHKDPSTYKRKTYLMRNHFNKIASSDAIFVVNDEKRGIRGYIGANVLMEMGLAFHLRKPIFVLNTVDKNMPVYEEVKAMNCIVVNQDLMKVKL